MKFRNPALAIAGLLLAAGVSFAQVTTVGGEPAGAVACASVVRWRPRDGDGRRLGPLECRGARAAGDLTALTTNAGLHITTLLRKGLGEDKVIQAAAEHGIGMMGLQQFFHTSPPQQGLLLGFGAIRTTDLPAALRALNGTLAAKPKMNPNESTLWAVRDPEMLRFGANNGAGLCATPPVS